MTDMLITIPISADLMKSAFERCLSGRSSFLGKPPIEQAIVAALDESSESIKETVRAAVREVLDSEEFLAKMKGAVQNSMINEAVRIGQAAARKAAMGG